TANSTWSRHHRRRSGTYRGNPSLPNNNPGLFYSPPCFSQHPTSQPRCTHHWANFWSLLIPQILDSWLISLNFWIFSYLALLLFLSFKSSFFFKFLSLFFSLFVIVKFNKVNYCCA